MCTPLLDHWASISLGRAAHKTNQSHAYPTKPAHFTVPLADLRSALSAPSRRPYYYRSLPRYLKQCSAAGLQGASAHVVEHY